MIHYSLTNHQSKERYWYQSNISFISNPIKYRAAYQRLSTQVAYAVFTRKQKKKQLICIKVN